MMWKASLFAIGLGLPAAAEDMRPQEADRLARFDTIAGAALRTAMAGGARGDVDRLQEALAGPPLGPLETTLSGEWSCRTLKLGGIGALTVYAAFTCRITPDGDGFLFEKRTGSQRTTGRISLKDGQMIYLGTGHVADVTPTPYPDLAPDFTGSGEVWPDVALVEQTGPGQARLMFPAPANESLFDILHLTR